LQLVKSFYQSAHHFNTLLLIKTFNLRVDVVIVLEVTFVPWDDVGMEMVDGLARIDTVLPFYE
jgi:hypothetical protein